MNMFFKKIGAALIAALICCITASALTVSAAANQKIELKASGSEAQLVLDLPQAAAEEISSLQIALSVSVSSDKAKIEFIPNSSLAAKIVESRYHSDTGVLNIYLAGTKALFSPSSPLTVGKLKITFDGSGEASATVGVVKDSLKFVRGSELVSPDDDVSYPNSVKITAGGKTPTTTSSDTEPEQPPVSTAISNEPQPPKTDSNVPPVTGGQTNSPAPIVQEPDVQVPVENPNPDVQVPVENPNPADTSALAEALSRANSYKRESYTESSYNILAEAMNKAQALLTNPYATQDEIDEALLILENAIGTLTLKNDIPSGGDGYGENSDETTSDSSENGNENTPEDTNDNPSTSSPDSQAPGTDDQSADDNGSDSDNSLIVWIIVLIVLAAAAAAIITVLTMKKKKTAKGKHIGKNK